MQDSQTDKLLFPILSTPDAMLAYIPENTTLSKKLASLTYEEFCQFTTNCGYILKPKQETYNEFIQICASPNPYIKNRFSLIKGRPFMPARDALLKWLNEPNMPHDLIFTSVPFAILYPARGPVAAKNIFGNDVPMTPAQQQQKPGNDIVVSTSFLTNNKGEIISPASGQAILTGHKLEFKPIYTISNVRLENMRKIKFPCSVQVNCELEGPLEWSIQGDLTVEGFWSANAIKITGNVLAKSGIQTNFPNDEQNAIVIGGNLDANFIQSSSFIIEGDAKIDKAISNSLLIVNGKRLECLGDPGKIAGCCIILKNVTTVCCKLAKFFIS